jgi:hypothetical protein
MAKIEKRTTRILPTSCGNKLHQHARTATARPCQSHRITGVEPNTTWEVAPKRTKKKVMQAFGIISGNSKPLLEAYKVGANRKFSILILFWGLLEKSSTN